MDDAAPEPRPKRLALRELFVQLVTITAGVLIALLLEGIVEWLDHRALAREARATIAMEIADNRKDLDEELQGTSERVTSFGQALRFADDVLAGRTPEAQSLSLSTSLASLDTSAWHTAERTGALSYMDYTEVKKYSEVYALQEIFTAHQRRVMEKITESLGIIALGDPAKAPRQDVERFRAQLLAVVAEFHAEEQLGKQLLAGYESALQP